MPIFYLELKAFSRTYSYCVMYSIPTSIFLCHTRNARIYYGLMSNQSLLGLYSGASVNISVDEIYNVNYNSSIPELGKLGYPINPNVIEVTIDYIYGLDGRRRETGTKLLKLPLLNSNAEVCFSFDFLKTKGAKNYKFSLKMFANSTTSFKGFMSLPNQTRSFDRFQLFKGLTLPENKTTSIAYSIFSMKFLEKRNTAKEPCVSVENYDKVNKYYL